MCLEEAIRMLKMSSCIEPQWNVAFFQNFFTMPSMLYQCRTGRKEKHNNL